MEIWITSHPQGYQWELFDDKGKPIAKSSPAHGDPYFAQERSAIAASKRMIKQFCSFCNHCTLQEKKRKIKCPFIHIYGMTNRNKKVLIK